MINRLTKIDIKMMKEDYVSPEVKFVEAIVEKGFLISAIIINGRKEYGVSEEHIVDNVEDW